MLTVGQILRKHREKLNLTLDALAAQTGVTKGYLSMIENHRVDNPPAQKVVLSIEKALGITDGSLSAAADWQNTPAEIKNQIKRLSEQAQRGQDLAKWIRETAKRKDVGKNLDALFASGALSRKVKTALGELEHAKETMDDRVPLRYHVPLINSVTAGYPKDFTDLGYPARVADEYVACPELADPDAFAARVMGESMLPQYHEDDVVVFSPQAVVSDGDDCFVRLEPDHESTFKRVFFEDPGKDQVAMIRLQPLNPKFPCRVVPRDQVAGLYKAVWRMQRL